ncbi:hypothetical protein F5B20DRAFT_591111 [Whalleya microplaca]|nr:hypothetical protein F5B20DRAFT_591111 [Whalleya microplaca]
MDHVRDLIDSASLWKLRHLLAKLCSENPEIRDQVLQNLDPESITLTTTNTELEPRVHGARPSPSLGSGSRQRLLPSPQVSPSFAHSSSRSSLSATMSGTGQPRLTSSPLSPTVTAVRGIKRRRCEEAAEESEDSKKAKRVQRAFIRCKLDQLKPKERVKKVQRNINQLQEEITRQSSFMSRVKKSHRAELSKRIEKMTSSLNTQRQLMWNLVSGL